MMDYSPNSLFSAADVVEITRTCFILFIYLFIYFIHLFIFWPKKKRKKEPALHVVQSITMHQLSYADHMLMCKPPICELSEV